MAQILQYSSGESFFQFRLIKVLKLGACPNSDSDSESPLGRIYRQVFNGCIPWCVGFKTRKAVLPPVYNWVDEEKSVHSLCTAVTMSAPRMRGKYSSNWLFKHSVRRLIAIDWYSIVDMREGRPFLFWDQHIGECIRSVPADVYFSKTITGSSFCTALVGTVMVTGGRMEEHWLIGWLF